MGIYQNKTIRAYKCKVSVTDNDGNDVPIGRAQSFSLTVTHNNESVGELNNDKPVEIIEGIEKISGKINELHVPGAGLMQVAVRDSDGELPYLTMTGVFRTKTGYKKVVVKGAKLQGFGFDSSVSEKTLKGDFGYDALDYDVSDFSGQY